MIVEVVLADMEALQPDALGQRTELDDLSEPSRLADASPGGRIRQEVAEGDDTDLHHHGAPSEAHQHDTASTEPSGVAATRVG